MSEELTITEFIRANLDRLEALAIDAANRTAMNWESDEKYPVDVTYTVDATTGRFEYVFYAEGQAEAANLHAAANGPAHVLTWVAAIRAVVTEVAGWRHEVVEDCWYTCAAATKERDDGECCDDNRRGGACDCGRDYRAQRILAPIAGIWAGQDGWQEAWK